MSDARPPSRNRRKPPGREFRDVSSGVANLPAQTLKVLSSYQAKIVRYLIDIAGLDGLRQLGTTHALPSQVLWYFKKIADLYDELTQFLVGQLRHRGFTVQCKPKCPHCCYNMPTDASIIELIFLYHGMRQTDAADRFFRRCLEVNELWGGVMQRFAAESCSPSEWGNVREKALRHYQSLERQCPFLQHGICQIYPYRPFACRMHFSLSPPYWCRPSHFQHSHALAFNVQAGTAVTAALARLDKSFELDLSDIMICGLLELTVNVMEFDDIRWLN